MSIGKLVLGTMAGLAIGALAGILFAPDKGSKTRQQIMDKSDAFLDSMKSKLDGIVDSVSEKFESTKNEAENLVEKGKVKFEGAKKDVKNAASNFKNDAEAEIKHATS